MPCARVHIVRADGKPDEARSGSDLAAAATESLRALRRHAVASVPLRLEAVTGLALSAAFLVEHDQWKDFLHAVEEQQRRAPPRCTSTSPDPGRRTISCACSSAADAMFCPACGTWNRASSAGVPAMRRNAARARARAVRAARTRRSRACAAPPATDIASCSRLGGGGMADVYVAEQAQLARRVVIKVLAPAPGARRRGRRALSARGGGGGEAGAPAHLRDPRLRRDAGRRVHGDAVSSRADRWPTRIQKARFVDADASGGGRRRRSRARSTTRTAAASCTAT